MFFKKSFWHTYISTGKIDFAGKQTSFRRFPRFSRWRRLLSKAAAAAAAALELWVRRRSEGGGGGGQGELRKGAFSRLSVDGRRE